MKVLAIDMRANALRFAMGLTAAEAVVLSVLLARDGEASRADMAQALALAGSTGESAKLLDVLVCRLRAKLGAVAAHIVRVRPGRYQLTGAEAILARLAPEARKMFGGARAAA